MAMQFYLFIYERFHGIKNYRQFVFIKLYLIKNKNFNTKISLKINVHRLETAALAAALSLSFA